MKVELEIELVNKYPELFKDYNNEKSAFHYGFEFSDGWFNLINTLAFNITLICNYTTTKVVVRQAKEKFGGLRFYCDIEGPAKKLVESLIDQVEITSYKTCEICGANGAPRKGSWLKTLCDNCDKK